MDFETEEGAELLAHISATAGSFDAVIEDFGSFCVPQGSAHALKLDEHEQHALRDALGACWKLAAKGGATLPHAGLSWPSVETASQVPQQSETACWALRAQEHKRTEAQLAAERYPTQEVVEQSEQDLDGIVPQMEYARTTLVQQARTARFQQDSPFSDRQLRDSSLPRLAAAATRQFSSVGDSSVGRETSVVTPDLCLTSPRGIVSASAPCQPALLRASDRNLHATSAQGDAAAQRRFAQHLARGRRMHAMQRLREKRELAKARSAGDRLALRYECRKRIADQRPRVSGRFVKTSPMWE